MNNGLLMDWISGMVKEGVDGLDRIGLFLCALLLLQIKHDKEECKVIVSSTAIFAFDCD